MSEYTVGFVGCGNMGFALASAAVKAVGGDKVVISAKNAENAKIKAEKLGCSFMTASDAAKNSRFVFLGIKPGKLSEVANEISESFSDGDGKIIVSMLAGVTVKTLASYFGEDRRVVRIMPNTPVAVGKGLTLMCASRAVTDGEKAELLGVLAHSGEVEEIDESLIDAASALSGCGPAFVYKFAEAMASGALLCGLPKKTAVRYALLTLEGASSLAASGDKHLGELTDEVCSPGGSTIEGVAALENGKFTGTVMDAVVKAYEKTKALGKK